MPSSPRRPRLNAARARLRAVLLTGLLTGLTGPAGLVACADPEPDPGAGTADGEVAFTEVAVLSESLAGGRPGPAVVLDGPDAVRELTVGLDSTRLTARVAETVARTEVPADQVLLGAVLAVGCDEPSGVAGVSRSDGTWWLEPAPYLGREKQCLVAATTVALVLAEPGQGR